MIQSHKIISSKQCRNDHFMLKIHQFFMTSASVSGTFHNREPALKLFEKKANS